MEQQHDALSAPGERRLRRRPGENRERLLSAGVTEFGVHGFHGASTTAIAARADVPQPHVYANFQTKRELFLGCFVRVCEELTESGGGEHIVEAAAPARAAQARLLLQAVAALGDTNLAPELRTELAELRLLLGPGAFDRLLLLGVEDLLEH